MHPADVPALNSGALTSAFGGLRFCRASSRGVHLIDMHATVSFDRLTATVLRKPFMKSLSLASLVVILMLRPAVAGPDDTTQNLISDPASMLDIGILRIDLALRSQDLGFLLFDWNANRLYVQKIILDGFPDAKSAEEACASWVWNVRKLADIDRETGKPYGAHSRFADFFSHEGFQRNNTPGSLYVDLDRLFILNCSAYGAEGSVSVTAPLLGTTYSIEKSDAKN